MLLSRFWYVFSGLLVGALLFMLFLAQSVHNRAAARALKEGLGGDSQVVSWYLKNDARERAAQLIKFAVNGDLARGLAESSRAEASIPDKSRDAVKAALSKVSATIAKDDNFDAIFAVDQHGRVVAHLGYEQALGVEGFELGGYSVVADALHGFIRDDTLLLDRLYRVVARPVEYDLGQLPAGALVGARVIDERFARELANRTGAATAFFVNGTRASAAAAGTFDKMQLDQIGTELSVFKEDAEFKEKGLSQVHTLRGSPIAAIYGRIPGETWQLDVGFAVARGATQQHSVINFFSKADDKDKGSVPLVLVILAALLSMGIGLALSFLEYTKPLRAFRLEAQKLAKGEIQQLQSSRFRSVLRQVASDLNDGIEHAAAQGGGTRRAADLKQVIGDIPDQPQMSAFSLPGQGTPEPPASSPMGSAPMASPQPPPSAPRAGPPGPPPRDGLERTLPQARRDQTGGGAGAEELDPEWQNVFAEFVRVKQSCGEPTEGLTFDKFKLTLKKNRDALIQRHGVPRVKFSVYVKEGRAALKANPVRE